MSDHDVTFHARPDGLPLHAVCSCGWSSRWLPWGHIREGDYGCFIAIGLAHARQGEPLPRDPVTAGRDREQALWDADNPMPESIAQTTKGASR